MKEKKLRRFIEKRMAEIQKNALLAVSTDSEEAIHQLRVNVKKLRAFIRIARLEPSAKHLHIPAKLKNIYKCAGDVRNLQLFYNDILPFFKKNAAYPLQAEGQIAQLKSVLFKTIKQFQFDKAIKVLLENLPEQVPKKQLNEFVQKRTKAADKLLMKDRSDNDLHSLRKYLKDIMYSIKSFHADESEYLPIAGKDSIRKLKTLSALLSAHQDYVVKLALLNAVIPDNTSIQDKAILTSIKKEWENKKRLLRASL